MSKTLNYYYSCLNNQGQSVYKCLINDSDAIQTVECLDYRKTRNYSMKKQMKSYIDSVMT